MVVDWFSVVPVFDLRTKRRGRARHSVRAAGCDRRSARRARSDAPCLAIRRLVDVVRGLFLRQHRFGLRTAIGAVGIQPWRAQFRSKESLRRRRRVGSHGAHHKQYSLPRPMLLSCNVRKFLSCARAAAGAEFRLVFLLNHIRFRRVQRFCLSIRRWMLRGESQAGFWAGKE